MIKKIVFCTLRDNKGATGGPGGVLFLQRTTLGGEINGVPCEYWFNKYKKVPLRGLLNQLSFFFRVLFSTDTYFFTHDIVSGAILSLCKKKYSLVFHHQGPIIEERRNLGGSPNDKIKEKYFMFCERKAFIHANTLHFPANGAAEMYFSSKFANCRREEVNVWPALYNIIPYVEPQEPLDFPLKADKDRITLFSLGTLTKAKGQDLVVDFLKKHISAFRRPVRYIMVGKGPLRDSLISELEVIKKDNPTFEYFYYEGVKHDTVMYIHKISDIYIMLHRISIFDFATLEAMSQKSAIVLSKVGGNKDFNLRNNILFAEDIEKDESLLDKADFINLKELNYQVFCSYFSEDAFREQYNQFFKNILN